MPCPICNDFKGSRENLEYGKAASLGLGTRNHKRLGLRWDELTTSALSCVTCDILVRGIRGCLEQHAIQESDIHIFSLFFYYPEYLGEEADTNKEFRLVLKDGSKFDIEMFCTEGKGRNSKAGCTLMGQGSDCPIPSEWEILPTYDRTSPSTDSDAAMATIQDWISSCLGPDDEFCDAPAEAELPARVIEVGNDNNSTIRLFEPPSKTTARYMCLSHCWGKEQIITTTKSTLKDRQVGIKMEDLSKTFQDAVTFTRRLGVKYIWIDSLCIVQDDPNDWAVESAKMSDIYSKAYLTIAATHSKDGRGGLFCETPDFEVSGAIPDLDDGDYRVFFRERIDHHLEVVDGDIGGTLGHATIKHHPILTRAWIYQERILSTRVLHFGRYELFFECRSDLACECGGIGYHGSSTAAPTSITKLAFSDALDSNMPGEDWVNHARYYIARMWRTMVSSYTALEITKHGDRLPAMGGLAKYMAARRKSDYVAGLWEDALMDDLLWYCGGSSTSKKPRPTPRGAPTWSWASVNRYVSYSDEIFQWDPEMPTWDYEREPYEHFARVEKCAVVPGGVDEFGAITQGCLQLFGLVATGSIEREVERLDGRDNVVHHIVFPSGVEVLMRADYLLDELGDNQVLPGTEVKCLRMSWLVMGSIEALLSLVLRRVVGVPGAYERIGCIRIEKESNSSPVDHVGLMYRSAVEQIVTIV